jgi:hypothetical protein
VRGNPTRIEVSSSARIVGSESEDLSCLLQTSWVTACQIPLELTNAVDNTDSTP